MRQSWLNWQSLSATVKFVISVNSIWGRSKKQKKYKTEHQQGKLGTGRNQLYPLRAPNANATNETKVVIGDEEKYNTEMYSNQWAWGWWWGKQSFQTWIFMM